MTISKHAVMSALSNLVDLQDGEDPETDDFAGLLQPSVDILNELMEREICDVCGQTFKDCDFRKECL